MSTRPCTAAWPSAQSWDERDQWDPSLRFRARVTLPQLSERFDAFVGRVDPEEYVTELRDDFDTLPRQFARQQDDAVLLGLGYGQPGRGGGHFERRRRREAGVAAGALCQRHLSLRAAFPWPQFGPSARSDLLGGTGTLRRDDAGRPGASARGGLPRALDQFGHVHARTPKACAGFRT